MTGENRPTWGLITDVLAALEQHGYHRADDAHAGRAIGFIGDLARVYEGTQEEPGGGYAAAPAPALARAAAEPQNPASRIGAGVGPAQLTTILAALEEAAGRKRDLAANCPSCPDRSCWTCQLRLQQASSYAVISRELIAGQVAATRPGGRHPQRSGRVPVNRSAATATRE